LGDRVAAIADLKPVVAPASSTEEGKKNPQTIAALPIGGRVKLDVWYDKLDLIKSKPVGTVAEREKMPFEVTPFMPYLTRYNAEAKPTNASSTDTKTPQSAASAADSKPADPVKP
jgi:hypothetical protein